MINPFICFLCVAIQVVTAFCRWSRSHEKRDGSGSSSGLYLKKKSKQNCEQSSKKLTLFSAKYSYLSVNKTSPGILGCEICQIIFVHQKLWTTELELKPERPSWLATLEPAHWSEPIVFIPIPVQGWSPTNSGHYDGPESSDSSSPGLQQTTAGLLARLEL